MERARLACLANLSDIGRALDGYMNDNDMRWPYVAKLNSFDVHTPPWPTLPQVLAPYVGDQVEMFRCPSDRRELLENEDADLLKRFPKSTTWSDTEGLSYGWYWGDARGGVRIGEESLTSAKGFGFGRADQTVLADFEPFHTGDGRGTYNSLFADFRARSSRPADDAS